MRFHSALMPVLQPAMMTQSNVTECIDSVKITKLKSPEAQDWWPNHAAVDHLHLLAHLAAPRW